MKMGKSIKLKEIVSYLDELLKLDEFSSDCSNNGLQFEGKSTISKIAFAVDGSAESFRKAAEAGADLLFVHHGISWGNGFKRIVGLDAERITLLARNALSLYAAHLPLDAHAGIGHNARLAAMAELRYTAPFGEYHGKKIGVRGELPEALSVEKLAKKIDLLLPSSGKILFFGDPERKVSRVGIISGGGAYMEAFTEMRELGLECLITGEMTHEAVSFAREANAAVIRLGHYRSETPGVLAVMSDVKRYFDVDVEFLDLPTSF